jgi:hypothetical protein
MRRLIALAFAASLAVGAVRAQTPEPRTFLLAVDDLHLDFRSTPRARKILQDVVKGAREDDAWALVTTGTSSVRVNPGPASAVLAAVSRVVGNQIKARESLNAFGDPDRAAIVRRRASGADIMIGFAISYFARTTRGPLTIVYLTDGYDARMVPGMSEVVRATAETRSRLVVIAVRDIVAPVDSPGDVKPEEWAAYVEATRTSIRALAEQAGGTAVFSREDLDAALTRLSRP